MNIEQEIRAQIEKNKGLKLAVGEINNHLSILEGLLRNERDDVQKQVDEAYNKGYDKGYADKTNNDEVCKKLAKDIQDEAYQRGYEDGKHNGLGEVKMREALEYQRGLDDAWEAAKKILQMYDFTVFGLEHDGVFESPLNEGQQMTPQEAIEKLKAYEEKQKADDEIKVGDEVVWTEDEDTVIIVTLIYTSSGIEWCDGICRDGKVYQIITEHARKTGRHFDIDKILEGMKE